MICLQVAKNPKHLQILIGKTYYLSKKEEKWNHEQFCSHDNERQNDDIKETLQLILAKLNQQEVLTVTLNNE